MNRAQKEDFVKHLSQGIQEAQAFALLSFTNLTVEQMTAFRLGLKKKDVDVKVVKNTLAKRVFGATAFKDLSPQFRGPTLIAYGKGDPVMTAKAIMEWAKKENFGVKLKGGGALGEVLNESKMISLSNLPGRNELLVSFLWALKSHPTNFLYALKDTPNKLGYALEALRAKKEKETA